MGIDVFQMLKEIGARWGVLCLNVHNNTRSILMSLME